jgi:hypothetical protein
MATPTVNLTTEGEARPALGAIAAHVLRKKIDFTETSNQLAQNQVMALFKVKAGQFVGPGYARVITADTDITDIDIGYNTDSGTTDDKICDGMTLATAGYVQGATDNNTTTSPAFMSADAYIVLTNKDAQTINGAVIEVCVIVYDSIPLG